MPKDGQERLLDLLTGWTYELGLQNDDLQDAVGDLYQEVGNREFMTDEDVRVFLIESVAPLLNRK